MFQDDTIFTFDPAPPPDSINLYSKPKNPHRIPHNVSAVGMFFQSLLPNFNIAGNIMDQQ